jgi:hypothetical protein
VVAAPVDLDLEVARVTTDATGELRGHTPTEMLELVGRGVPGREHGRAEPLKVAVHIACHRPDVMSGHDPPPIVVEAAQDHDDPQMRQLVIGEADRRPPERVEDLVERIGMDRRGQPVADRRRSDRDPRRITPGVSRRVVGQLVDQQDGCVRADRLGVRGRVRRARPAELGGLREPVERLVLPGELHDADVRRQEVEQRAEHRRLADELRLGRHDDRDAGLDEQPELRGELRIERARPDQLDDRSRFGAAWLERWASPRRRDVGHRPADGSNPVSSAETSHSRRATAGSRVDAGGSIALA